MAVAMHELKPGRYIMDVHGQWGAIQEVTQSSVFCVMSHVGMEVTQVPRQQVVATMSNVEVEAFTDAVSRAVHDKKLVLALKSGAGWPGVKLTPELVGVFHAEAFRLYAGDGGKVKLLFSVLFGEPYPW